MKKSTDILILCGGLGTRLHSVLSDTPKGLAPINNVPFIDILIRYFSKQGYSRFILCTGHLHEQFESVQQRFLELDIIFSREESALGTGGAIVHALSKVQSESIIVINGDTFLDVSLADLEAFHYRHNADISFCLTQTDDSTRYGLIDIDDMNRVTSFKEKDPTLQTGLINSGFLMMNPSIFSSYKQTCFSLEQDFISNQLDQLKVMGFIQKESLFIDIGLPESYDSAQQLLKKFT